MSEDNRPHHPVILLCELLGFSRQAYYKRTLNTQGLYEADVLETSIVLYCRYLRRRDHLPKAGFRELFLLCKQHFGEKFVIGRDRFCALLRANDLMLRKRRYRPRTTNSAHPFHKYEDLLNTDPKYVPGKPGDLVVADITYIAYRGGFAYLSLLTDAYTRCIVGHCLHPTLEVEGCITALEQAFEFYKKHKTDIRHMIHHSDRGVQYASSRYTQLLTDRGCRISMTQTGDPLHNALAERINNTLKNSWYISSEDQTLEEAAQAVAQAIRMYNEARPHQAIGGRTPMQLLQKEAQNLLVPGKEDSWSISPKLYAKLNSEQRAKFVSCQRLSTLTKDRVNQTLT